MGNLAQLGDHVLADPLRSSLSCAPVWSALTNKMGERLPLGPLTLDRTPSMRRLLTVRDIACLLHCHPETVYRQIRTEDLPAKRHGNRWKFDPVEIANWLQQRTAKKKGPCTKEQPTK